MASAIEWTEDVWNPTTGCDRVSPGCDGCYAVRMSARLQHHPAYEGVVEMTDEGLDWTGKLNLVDERLDQPLRWKRPRRIFVNSMSDLFHEAVPVEYLADVFAVMAAADWHTFQILTKRPKRMAGLVDDRLHGMVEERLASWLEDGFVPKARAATLRSRVAAWRPMADWPLPNVWLGTSIESDRYAFRANWLRETETAVAFLSVEPLLGPLPSLNLDGIDWVIVGGESGPRARPMHPRWVRDVRDACAVAEVPFFFKQWGEWGPRPDLCPSDVLTGGRTPEDGARRRPGMERFTVVEPEWSCGRWYDGNAVMERVGKHEAGRLLDGLEWSAYPREAVKA